MADDEPPAQLRRRIEQLASSVGGVDSLITDPSRSAKRALENLRSRFGAEKVKTALLDALEKDESAAVSLGEARAALRADGSGAAPDSDSGSHTQEHTRQRQQADDNTIWLEFVTSQGRNVNNQDVLDVVKWVEDVILEEANIGEGVRSVDVTERGIFGVGGDDREDLSPQREVSDFIGREENRVHVFVKLDNNTLRVEKVENIADTLRRQWENSDISTGRGVNAINVVDERVVKQTAPEQVQRPREDAEVF